jgi:hypothetical protein
VVAGRRLKGITSCYVRAICCDAEPPILGRWGTKKVRSEARTQICGLGSSPVFNDAPFKFRFARATGMSLILTAIATDGPERAMFEWDLLLSPLEGVKGWVNVRNLTATEIDPPPQLNLQVTFRWIGEPLHLKLLRPHVSPQHIEEIRAQTAAGAGGGKLSVLSPSDDMRNDWLRRMPPNPPEWVPAVRLTILALIIVALYVVPGFMLFKYKP